MTAGAPPAGRARPRYARPPPLAVMAAVLSLFVPGGGHVYVGAFARAFAALAVRLLAIVAALVCYRLDVDSPWPTALGLALPIVVTLAIAVDAARTGAARERTGGLARGIGWFALWAAFSVLLIKGVTTWARAAWLEPSRVASDAMLPTLVIGDELWIDRRAYRAAAPARGDVVVHRIARDEDGGVFPADRRPDLPADRFVKRIVGVPGDVVEVREGALWIDGAPVPVEPTPMRVEGERGELLLVAVERLGGRPHRIADDPARGPVDAPPHVVEPDRYYVLGDNRDHSNDSRLWGTVHRRDIEGRATHLYWSAAPADASEVRWERIGRRIE